MLMDVTHGYIEVKVLKDIIKSCDIAQFLQWLEPKGHHLHVPWIYTIFSQQHPWTSLVVSFKVCGVGDDGF